MNPLKKFYRLYRKQKIKSLISKQEQSFGAEFPLKYIFDSHPNSKILIVVYSAFPMHGEKASYNYLTALYPFHVNKLFLLDEYGVNKEGCYYLGEDGNYQVRENVFALIDSIKKQVLPEKTYHVGSSKGGWAAFYFGLSYPQDIILSGGPQYLLGDYLNLCMQPLFTYITGKMPNDEDREKLNRLILDKMIQNAKQEIYLHYSEKEHTYKDQIQYLISDLKKMGYDLHEDVKYYPQHKEVGLYFADYLSHFFRGL